MMWMVYLCGRLTLARIKHSPATCSLPHAVGWESWKKPQPNKKQPAKSPNQVVQRHHLLQAEWCSVSLWAETNPQVCIAQHDVAWHGLSVWLTCQLSPATSLPRSANSSWGQSEKQVAFTLYKHCSAVAKTLTYHQHCFSLKLNAAPYGLLWSNFIPARPSTSI